MMDNNKKVVFGAVGDINLSGTVASPKFDNGFDWAFQKMLPHLRQAELLFGNLESVVAPPDYPPEQIDPKGLIGRCDCAPALKRAGFDVLNLAQNHILDAGVRGMFHTQELVRHAGIAAAGIGNTQEEARRLCIVEKNGLRFGFLCYCEDTNYSLSTTGPCHAYYTRETVLEDVARHRDEVDVLVVSIHADLEFMPTPSVPRQKIMREIARAGATLVLAHHPHVPQGIERIGDSLVVYSLGNFIFASHSDSYMRENLPHTGHSFLLLAEVQRRRVNSFERVPFIIHPAPEERPTPAEGADRESLLKYFAELDALAADDQAVARNWRQIAIDRLAGQLERAKTMTCDDLLVETLGRLLLVQENRSWVDEVMRIVKDNWAKQANTIDPLHRPHYVITSRHKPQPQLK